MVPTKADVEQLSIIVSPGWLAENSGQPAVKAIDVRPSEAYADGHIPGAINIPFPLFQTVRDDTPEMLVEQSDFEARAGRLGICETDTLVVYDDMWGMPAARILWAFERYGHRAIHFLDGGLERWIAEGRPITTDTPPITPTTYRASPRDDREASHTWLRAHLHRPDIVIVDTRSPAEYEQGHIPGAVNWDWNNALSTEGSSSLRPTDDLRADLQALGVKPDREIVVYCQSGARSAHVYLTLRWLGYPRVRNYDGSWLAWSTKETVYE